MHRTPIASMMRGFLACLVVVAAGLFAATAFADAQTEKEAAELQRKAVQEDFLNVDYPSAIKKLQSAVSKCGADKCRPTVRGAVLRDLGAMQILGGAVEEGRANFALAVAADPSLELDPAYKNPKLEAAWSAAKQGAGGAGGGAQTAPTGGANTGAAGASGATGAGPAATTAAAGGSAQPSGDFKHTPVPEQAVRTPVPVYVEYLGSETLTKVLAKYKAPGMSEWKPVELPKMGDGWGGLIPCKDVTEGKLLYFLQGFNAENDPVATGGNRDKAYSVPIKESIDGAAPSLPGQDPPKQCGELAGAECPPNFPGCNSKKGAGEDCDKNKDCQSDACVGGKCEEKKGSGEDCEKDDECASGTCKDDKCEGGGGGGSGDYNKMWGGIGLGLDLLLVPGDNDVCALNSTGTGPLTSGSPYTCYDPTFKTSFPVAGMPGQALNQAVVPTSSQGIDSVGGGFVHGPMTLFASFDYALNPNILIGARAGYEFFTYPGNVLGPAFPPLRFEARLTYLLGANAINQTIAPVFFGGVGVGEFDAFVPTTVVLGNVMPPAPSAYQSLASLPENAWLTAGPLYVTGGGGIRLAFGGDKKNIALTGLMKLEGAFGGTAGFLFGIAPELAIQYGF